MAQEAEFVDDLDLDRAVSPTKKGEKRWWEKSADSSSSSSAPAAKRAKYTAAKTTTIQGLTPDDFSSSVADGVPVCPDCGPAKSRAVQGKGYWSCANCAVVIQAEVYERAYAEQETSTLRKAKKKASKEQQKEQQEATETQAAQGKEETKKRAALGERRTKAWLKAKPLLLKRMRSLGHTKDSEIGIAAYNLLEQYVAKKKQVPNDVTNIVGICVWWTLAVRDKCLPPQLAMPMFRRAQIGKKVDPIKPARLVLQKTLDLVPLSDLAVELGMADSALKHIRKSAPVTELEHKRCLGLVRWMHNAPFIQPKPGVMMTETARVRKSTGGAAAAGATGGDESDNESVAEGSAEEMALVKALDKFFRHLDVYEAQVAAGKRPRHVDLCATYEDHKADILDATEKAYAPHNRRTTELFHEIHMAEEQQDRGIKAAQALQKDMDALEARLGELAKDYDPNDEKSATATKEIMAEMQTLRGRIEQHEGEVKEWQDQIADLNKQMDEHGKEWKPPTAATPVNQQHPFFKIETDVVLGTALYAVLSRPGAMGSARRAWTADQVAKHTLVNPRTLRKYRIYLAKTILSIDEGNWFRFE